MLIPFPHPSNFTSQFIQKVLYPQTPLMQKAFPFTGISIHSNEIIPGCIFVALMGENQDGHHFIQSAIDKGARGIICQKTFPCPKEVYHFQVPDSLKAYRHLAHAWRMQFNLPIVVVAGSAGKTTTKEFIAALFRGKWKNVLKTKASQNGSTGIPLTLFQLNSEHDIAVIEIGIDQRGAMQEHMELIQPQAALLTTIGPEHLLHLKDLHTVAQEEGLALEMVAKKGGIIGINLDDPWISPYLHLQEGKKIPYSFQGPLNHQIKGTFYTPNQLCIQGLGYPKTLLSVPLPGKHNASNLLGAVAIAHAFQLNIQEITQGLQTFEGLEGRSEVHFFENDYIVITDYYNAQPYSMQAGIELLSSLALQKNSLQTWAILGDMLDLGLEEEYYHRKLSIPLIQNSIQRIFLLGERMQHLKNELLEKNFSGQVDHFNSHEELANRLLNQLQTKTSLIIKGSRGMQMEKIWKFLKKSFLQKGIHENTHPSLEFKKY